MGEACQVLTRDEVIQINREMVTVFSGTYIEYDDNLAHSGSLDHVFEEIQGALFGQELHPTVIEKCAVLDWRIIAGHVFHDGNKRTGLEACRLMLELNGLKLEITEEAIEVSLQIARSEMQSEGFMQWLKQRVTKPSLASNEQEAGESLE